MIGKTLGSRYEILDKIDSGGMAYVYKALCKKTNKTVAIKVLKDEFAGSSEYVQRFKREAQAAFSLEHDNVVSVYDVGFDENVYYMVMEYVNGPTLKNIIENSGFLPESQAIEYALQICNGLSAAHKKGIIHRDIKPHNILVDENDTIKITDFGIAKSVTSKAEKGSKVIGSVFYVSPEQAKGEVVDQRTDIYSFGIMMFEMLTGELPYKGEKSVAVALKHINEKITPPKKLNSELSESINRIIIKATSKNKDNRYTDMGELKKDLTLSLVDKEGDFIELRIESPRVLRSINIRKNNIWKIAVITVTLVVLIVGGLFGGNAIFGSPEEQQTPMALLNVPNIIGSNISEAQAELENLGLNLVVVYKNSVDFEADTVIDQSPNYGTKVLLEDSVLLTVSLGPEVIYMPDLIGMTKSEAEGIIQDMGFTVEEIAEEVNNDVPLGTVIEQVPAADSDMLEGSAVALVISTQSDQDKGVVPHVLDISLEQAVEILNEAGFVNTFIYQEPSEKEQGTVIGQSPAEGLNEQFDRDIDLHISQYNELEYFGTLDGVIEITDVVSKVKIVFEDELGSTNTSFIIRELNEVEPGELELKIDISALSGGEKTVRVYINKLLSYEFLVYFAKRVDENEG